VSRKSIGRLQAWSRPSLSLPHLQARMGECREILLKMRKGINLWSPSVFFRGELGDGGELEDRGDGEDRGELGDGLEGDEIAQAF
jgi:hypothetical protein